MPYVETSFYLHWPAWYFTWLCSEDGALDMDAVVHSNRHIFPKQPSPTHFHDSWGSIICITPWSLKLFSGLQRLILNNISKAEKVHLHINISISFLFVCFFLSFFQGYWCVYVYCPRRAFTKFFHKNNLPHEMFYHISTDDIQQWVT